MDNNRPAGSLFSEEPKEAVTTSSGESLGADCLCYVILDDQTAEDNLVPALSDQECASRLYNSRYVYIDDGTREYFGQILRGPIYTPEWGAVRDGTNIYPIVSGDKVEYVPSYHGFVQILILGAIEESGGRRTLQKTFHRPHPKSKVRYVPEQEVLPLLGLPGDGYLLGVLANYSTSGSAESVRFFVEDRLVRKQLGIFGATGQGKSNTVLALAEALAANEWCVILFDHSGEYCECGAPSDEDHLFTTFWQDLKVRRQGVKTTKRLVPVSVRDCPAGAVRFSVESRSVPYRVLKSLLRLSEAQDELLDLLRRGIEVYDGLASLKAAVERLDNEIRSKGPLLRKIDNLINLGAGMTNKYRLFDNARRMSPDVNDPPVFGSSRPANPRPGDVVYLSAATLMQAGTIVVVDFGDVNNQDVINVVALDILAKLQREKSSVRRANRTKVAVFLEEAHTYFSAEYTGNEQIASSLVGTVKKIFKIGRKFYLNPVVISQQPSDVPASILAQCNTKIIHQLSDEDDIRKVTKGSAKRYQNVVPDLRTGEALITNSEFTAAQVVRIRPAMSRKIDPFLVKSAIEPSADQEDDQEIDIDDE